MQEEGALKKVEMTTKHCDITFVKKEDALQAHAKYNGVTLDGLKMSIQVLKTGISPKKGGDFLGGGGGGREVKFTVTM